MRIHRINVDNFKSLIEFSLDLAKFTCLIGLNGVGKSTVLQCVDFLAQHVRGDIKEWLGERTWRASDLNSRLVTKKNILFSIEMVDDENLPCGFWKASFNTSKLHCTSEHIRIKGEELVVQDGSYSIYSGQPETPVIFRQPSVIHGGSRPAPGLRAHGQWVKTPIAFSYQGSILSQLKEEGMPRPIIEFKRFFEKTRSLDLLSPEHLRQRTRESDGSLGLGGKRLSSFLHELGAERRSDIAAKLKDAYKQLDEMVVRPLRSGWKQLEIRESYGEKKLVTEARHINDGMLRLTAILAELGSDHGFLLLDEIENGVNPELVEFLVNLLTATTKQVLVTTHSPVILNYLDDETARSAVMYLYKTAQGFTKSVPFFSIPSLSRKLQVMGPGEAFVDTNLTFLGEEIEPTQESR